MKAVRVNQKDPQLIDSSASWWNDIPSETLPLAPTPLSMVRELSPFLANSRDHGLTQSLQVQLAHNGGMLAVRLRWAAEQRAAISDLDQFVDGAAVMFPCASGASAMTMGAKDKPVNAWYWRADKKRPYEVIAEGFRFVERLPDNGGSDLGVAAHYQDGHWHVVFRRSLGARGKLVRFASTKPSGIAFAVWSGANAERSGRKAFSGDFIALELL